MMTETSSPAAASDWVPGLSPYRSQNCGALRLEHVGCRLRLAGWLHRKRDHGDLLFLDLRDSFGITQCVSEVGDPHFETLERLRPESVIMVTGRIVARSPETVNAQLPTGLAELVIEELEILSAAEPLPLQVNAVQEAGEEQRLRYRYLDLRRAAMQDRMRLRSAVISSLRRRMEAAGFMEFQTPILTAASPEGARDYLVPSRLHAGKFYALPQAPQIFKQLLMIAGFDRYFQIAPCFRDEDARADRSPGEFYQLDLEMSFVTQEEVFATLEPILGGLFEEFADGAAVTATPFPRLTYAQARQRFGSDKPDLRNPLELCDVSDVFAGGGFSLFAREIAKGAHVIGIPAPGAGARPRSFFDGLNSWARAQGSAGLGYMIFGAEGAKGPIARNLEPDRVHRLQAQMGLAAGDAVFFVCQPQQAALDFAGIVRTRLGMDLNVTEKQGFRFCWIVDFPMYERDPASGALRFSHNPFSMPQGGLEALKTQDPLEIKAYQYDIVCNGVELSSGAIRNHLPEVLLAAFALVGYSAAAVEARFGGILNALRMGAPPHGGSAPGIDRMIMLLAGTQVLREVVAFPMNQQAEDLMMAAPAVVAPERLKELHLQLDLSTDDEA